ncbi:MAG: 5-Nucleotidase domain protein [Eubacterium sp.]|nr:5-Nucleotidase domain protein [Eubacterium sp.]
MKKYRNLIVLGVIILGVAIFLVYKNVNFNDLLLKFGYYEEKVSVINTADVHGHIIYDSDAGGYYTLDEVNVMMGMPLMKTIVDEIRQKDEDALLLDSGDMFHGTNEANVQKAQGIVEEANLMGYNAMVVGNHDFDFGMDRLIEIKSQLNYPMLSANIYKDGKPLFQQYKIVKIGDKKIGLFGLTVEDALVYTNSKDTKGVTVQDPIKAAEKMVEFLKKETDSIILISHLGDEIDKQVVDQVKGIDLILCGHHHFLYEKAVNYKGTYLVEAGGYSTHVGLAEMYFRKGKITKVVWKVIQSTDEAKANKEMKKVGEKYYALAMEAGKEQVGKAAVTLDGVRSRVRSQETNLANLLTDAMRETGNADLALMNGGGIRESIPSGDVNLYNIGKALPFSNYLVTAEVKGEKIYQALERGIRQYPNSGTNGGFLQVSGINYVFDASKNAGDRVVSITINGEPLDKNKNYKVALNDYIFNGGDNFTEFEDSKLLYRGELLKDVLAKYIKENKEVNPATEGRIKVINERYK